MYELYLKSDNRYLGDISEADMQFLRDSLEEESLTDDDYTISPLTYEYLKSRTMSPALSAILADALAAGGGRDDVEIVYRPKDAA